MRTVSAFIALLASVPWPASAQTAIRPDDIVAAIESKDRELLSSTLSPRIYWTDFDPILKGELSPEEVFAEVEGCVVVGRHEASESPLTPARVVWHCTDQPADECEIRALRVGVYPISRDGKFISYRPTGEEAFVLYRFTVRDRERCAALPVIRAPGWQG